MKNFVQRVIDAFQPNSMRRIAREAQAEADAARALEAGKEKQIAGSRALIQAYVVPCFDVLTSLPEKDGRKFKLVEGSGALITDAAGPHLYYGADDNKGPVFWQYGARKTIFGNPRFKRYFHSDYTQKSLAREFAKWVYKAAPDRIEEVRKALEDAPSPQARAFAPKA